MNDPSSRGARPAFSGAADEPCGTCGGDRRIGNSFGLTTTCPSCHGSGRRAEDGGFRDVTKTKPSHFAATPTNRAAAATRPQWPTTFAGGALATQVKDSGATGDAKAKLIREIVDHEVAHGVCTQTFIKKVRRQVRPAV